ncbi:MAG: hypothetical protein NUV52_02230 [Candidatus Roizmanbacteria bacterium]|nr:hypothetical protein [Candidatus Roizmanbacteria bacterium]
MKIQEGIYGIIPPMDFLIPDFRSQSMRQIEQITPEAIIPMETDDIEQNYTIVLRPEQKAIDAADKLIQQINEIDPGQYRYPLNQLHITLLGNLAIETGAEIIIQAIKHHVTKEALRFIFFGLGSNGQSSSISAYPIGIDIAQLRVSLRRAIGIHGDDYTTSLPAYEKVCWMNYMRYKKSQNKHCWIFYVHKKIPILVTSALTAYSS